MLRSISDTVITLCSLSFFLLVLLKSRPVSTFVVHKFVDTERSKHLELIEHALNNDVDWYAVLHQKIIVDDSNRPPYQTDSVHPETRAKLRIFDDGLSELAPLPVLQSVVRDFGWIGSHVEYAAYVLRTALMCFTYGNLSAAMGMVNDMGRAQRKSKKKGDEIGSATARPSDNRATIGDMWSMLAVLMDKMAAVDGQLNVMADLSYTLADLLLSDSSAQFAIVGLLRAEFDALIRERCVAIGSEQLVYTDLVVYNAEQSTSEVAVEPENLKTKFDKFVNDLLEIYNKLNIQTLAMHNWGQILNFQVPVTKNLKFDLIIDRLLKDDSVGKRIKEKIRKIKELSFLEKYVNVKEKEDKKGKKKDKQGKKKGKKDKHSKEDEINIKEETPEKEHVSVGSEGNANTQE